MMEHTRQKTIMLFSIYPLQLEDLLAFGYACIPHSQASRQLTGEPNHFHNSSVKTSQQDETVRQDGAWKALALLFRVRQVSTSVRRRQERQVGSQNNTVRRTCLHQLTEGAKQGRVASEQIRHFPLPAQRVQIHSSQFHTRVKPHFYSKGGGCAPPL